MSTFSFQAMNSGGDEVRDEIEASSQEEAVEKIRQLGLYPTSVRLKSADRTAAPTARAARPVGKRTITLGGVSNKQLCLFTRQLSTLQDAGLPLVRSVRILAGQLKPGLLKNSLNEIAEDVESGSSFSEALAKHPRVFDRLYVNMVRAGEAGGVLDTILARLADFKEKARKLRSKIIGAMIYPVAVVTIAITIVSLIMVFIVPKFEEIFVDFGAELPRMTKILIAVSGIMFTWKWAILLVPVGAVIFVKLIKQTHAGRLLIDRVKLYMPVFGAIVRKSTVSRFCRTLGTLISSGVPILEALNIVKDTSGNEVISRAIGKVHDSIKEGDTIAEPLRQSGVVDDMVVNMVDVGEETGDLDKMLIKVADVYDEEVDGLVASMMSLLEPMIIVFLGLMVGAIVVSLFLPLISLMTGMAQHGS